MAIAPVLKTGVRKDLGVRIPRPPLSAGAGTNCLFRIGPNYSNELE